MFTQWEKCTRWIQRCLIIVIDTIDWTACRLWYVVSFWIWYLYCNNAKSNLYKFLEEGTTIQWDIVTRLLLYSYKITLVSYMIFFWLLLDSRYMNKKHITIRMLSWYSTLTFLIKLLYQGCFNYFHGYYWIAVIWILLQDSLGVIYDIITRLLRYEIYDMVWHCKIWLSTTFYNDLQCLYNHILHILQWSTMPV
jgi:hypothetical protein